MVISALLIVLVALLFYKDYASLFRNNKELVKSLSPSNSITASLSWYSHNQTANLPLVKIGEDARQRPEMQNGPRKNLTILVLGETSRAADFSLGGYERETNPLLKRTMSPISRIPPRAERRRQFPYLACFPVWGAPITTTSLPRIRKGCWILFSAPGLRCCGMKMTVAAKAHAPAYRLRI